MNKRDKKQKVEKIGFCAAISLRQIIRFSYDNDNISSK
ncbi:hypothetical protein BN1221_04873c [Brenneria goodwinii]|uniref:Uncharacterized protein n=1 Tax=Brenneria goodwinii TaxID=1109412 RepID=A0A0G4K320_9GAMM|nr:hypothetical protein BN1221_04873c [Brenneria goodwinii]